MTTSTQPIGQLLKDWRQRQRLSHLELASDADVSARHVSFVKTGRARPSREMIERLSERLNILLRERNLLMLAGGFAPTYPEKGPDDPELASAREAVDLIPSAHEPYPALAVDRHWNLVRFNRVVPMLLRGVSPRLVKAPVNVLRLSLDPEGLAPRILNLPQWRSHLIGRLRRQIDITGDLGLVDLLEELQAYPEVYPSGTSRSAHEAGGVVVPMRLQTERLVLEMISMTTVFGTPLEVTLSELAIMHFYPANPETAQAFCDLADRFESS